jgi:hypothetical protein
MRARLTKVQMQMLLDGKPVTNGRVKFVLPEGESETRKVLQSMVSNEALRKQYAIFLDMSDLTIVVEEYK